MGHGPFCTEGPADARILKWACDGLRKHPGGRVVGSSREGLEINAEAVSASSLRATGLW